MADAAEPLGRWRAWRAGRGWGVVLPLVAALPAVRAMARNVRAGWVPIADEGVIALRAHDVLTDRTPALGQMSLASAGAGAPTRSPGPLGYWVLAPAAQVGPLWLVAMAAGVVAIAALVATVHLAGRRGGLGLAVVVTAGLVLSARAVDPINHAVGWNPSIGLAPMALLVLLAWSVGVGERGLLPAAVLVASFVGQVHIVYLPPAVTAIGVAVAAGWGPEAVAWWRGRRVSPRPPGPPVRPLALAGVVGLGLWSAPLLQQLLRRPGNLVLVTRSADGETQGLDLAGRVLAWSVGLPPAWARDKASGLEILLRLTRDGPALRTVSALGVAAGLVALAGRGIRRRDREMAVPPLLVLALGAAAVPALAATPASPHGISIAYTTWWLVPVGMLAWVVLVSTALRAAPALPATVTRATPVLLALAVVATAAVAVATPIRDPEDHMYPAARAAGDAVVAEIRAGGRYQVEALGALGLQLAPGLAYRIRRAGGHPVIHGGDGVSAGPEYVPHGDRCTAVIAVVAVPRGEPRPPSTARNRVLDVIDIAPGPAVDARRAAVMAKVDDGPPSC